MEKKKERNTEKNKQTKKPTESEREWEREKKEWFTSPYFTNHGKDRKVCSKVSKNKEKYAYFGTVVNIKDISLEDPPWSIGKEREGRSCRGKSTILIGNK